MRREVPQYPLAACQEAFVPFSGTSCSFTTEQQKALRVEGTRTIINSLTLGLLRTYKTLNPSMEYKPTKVSRRPLTNPNVPRHNEGRDNENYDLILRVGDVLFSEPDPTHTAGWIPDSQYRVVDVLGQGTFGQVVKCRSEKDGSLVAVKVLKNKAAYFKQGLYEIGILTLLNRFVDADGSKHTLRLVDHFLYHNHLCIVNELLSINIFELIKQNSFRGISIRLIQKFISQLLDALIGLEDFDIIHCDLKPENILLESLNTTHIRLIDFGSACMEHAPQYSYIQSRHYRAPEVLLGLQYTCSIDVWSVGCITAELLLGIPLFPGANEYNQMFKIAEMLGGFPPAQLIEKGTRAPKLFKKGNIVDGQQQFVFKTEVEYQRDSGVRIDPDKRYFVYRTLKDIVRKIPLKAHGQSPEAVIRSSLEHFLRGLLHLDPAQRWTASVARCHPFLKEGHEGEQLETFPSPQLLAEIDAKRERKVRRATLPPTAFQKTISRETLFPPSVVKSNGVVDYIRAYGMFMNALRMDRIIDIATDNPICPILEEKLAASRHRDEEMDQDNDEPEGMDIEKQPISDDTIIAKSFSQNYNIVAPAGFQHPQIGMGSVQSLPPGSIGSVGFGTSVGGGLVLGQQQNITTNNTNFGGLTFGMNPPIIPLGQSLTGEGLAFPPMAKGAANSVAAPSARNKK